MLAAQHRLLSMAVAVSLLFHLVLLSLHFAPPDSARLKPLEAGLDIILVNASDDKVPLKAEALAQANLDGGGNADAGRATSPLPNSNNVVDGDALKTQRQRIEELEQQQRRVLAQIASNSTQHVPQQTEQPAQPVPHAMSASAAQQESLALARREAEIAQRIEDYNKRPLKTQITPSTRGVAYAMYYTALQKRIEQTGTQYFPQSQGKKMYGELVMYIPIFQDGSLYLKEGGPRIERSSGNAALDRAALGIVQRAAPFGRLPAMLQAGGKDRVWEIITRFAFTRDDTLATRLDGSAQ